MAKAAEGVERELEKLAARETRPSTSKALDRDHPPPPIPTDRLREDAGWSKLD